VDFLEKLIWEKYQKNIHYRQLLNVAEIDSERSTESYGLNKRGDIFIPLNYNKNFWGQFVVESGSDLDTIAISQIVDLVDLYFKLKVSNWTSEVHAASLANDQGQVLSRTEKSKIFYLKSSSPEKVNYIISYIQEKVGAQGKLTWSPNFDLEDLNFQALIVINKAELIKSEELLKIAFSENRPHIVMTSSAQLQDWYTWAVLDKDVKAKLAINDADLDTMPSNLTEAKDCIDLLWFEE
jgi:hypothetical protein